MTPNSRSYLNHFTQPDSIVPDPYNSQDYDRYSYVRNNPLRYNDASGHCVSGAEDYKDCMKWAKKIEEKWGFIRVDVCQEGNSVGKDCAGWTAYELELLYESLDEYILKNQIDDGNLIYFIRTHNDDYAGLHTGYERSTDGYRYSEIRISDSAWTTEPGMGMQDAFDFGSSDNNFKSTIVHELTHAAVWFHPELMDAYRETRKSLGAGNNFLIRLTTGIDYDWSTYDKYKDDQLKYALLVDGEYMAMGVAASMYDDWFGTYK